MSALTNRNRTLGELMTELRARLGFVTQGSAATANDTKIQSFLQESHEYVYAQLEPPAQRKRCTLNLQAGSYLYDWHNDALDENIDPGRVLSLHILGSEGVRQRLRQGIRESDRLVTSLPSQPTRYDTLDGQLELNPIPGQSYPLQIEYIAERGRFEQATDRPSVPDRLVFLYALATAKASYRHPDAQAAATAFQSMLDKAKMQQRENRRYFMGAEIETGPLQVERGPNGTYLMRGG